MGVIVGGDHALSEKAKMLNSSDGRSFRVLTIRLGSDADSECYFGDSGGRPWGYLQEGESWTFGPGVGTLRATDLHLWGTPGVSVYYVGVEV